MNTIYTNDATRKVYLDVPVNPIPGTLDITITSSSGVTHEVQSVTAELSGFSFVLPFFLSNEEAELKVNWKFDYLEGGTTYTYNQNSYVEIVTPYVSIKDITELADGSLSLYEMQRVEKGVRHIINAHTGQTFGLSTDTKAVKARYSGGLSLPARLLELKSFNGSSYIRDFAIEGDGYWLVHRGLGGVPSVKADNNEYHQHVGGVIHNPNNVRPGTFSGGTYEVGGRWGWEYVPEPVKEAALLLANDYACADSNYRDRYLTSMTAADWRIQFHANAFAKTGNVRADQLLEEYVRLHGWAVI